LTVTKESVQAYYAIPDLEDRQAKVLDCIRNNPDVSYLDVAEKTKMIPKNVSSRISELLKDEKIFPSGSKVNPQTGRSLTTYRVIEKQVGSA